MYICKINTINFNYLINCIDDAKLPSKNIAPICTSHDALSGDVNEGTHNKVKMT